MYHLVKPILFLLNAELAHKIIAGSFNAVMKIPGLKGIIKAFYSFSHPSLERQVFGIKFKNPIGLAAGFDKDGKYLHSFSSLGFGFYEIGTVTPKAQVGNPKPRLFRLPEDEALINRMGFNNDGVDEMLERLKSYKKNNEVIIGGNIGKNKATPNESAVDDYVICFEKLFDFVDYFVVNVSSPNTPNLRALQNKEPLQHLLQTLQDLNNRKDKRKPLLLKIAPDLTEGQLDDVIVVAKETKLDGLIATNTTISRKNLKTNSSKIEKIGNGGLSGKILQKRSTEIIRYIVEKTNGKLPIIAVGGIDSFAAAKEKLDAGASLIQVYTGLIYQGPSLIKDIKKGLKNN